MRRIWFEVRGRVQGVGFRAFTCALATTHGVTGWVRNESDGAVAGEAQGSTAALEAFVASLRDGPRFGRVDALDTGPRPVRADSAAFVIRSP